MSLSTRELQPADDLFMSAGRFSALIYDKAREGVPLLDAVMCACVEHNIEPEAVKCLLTKTLKSDLGREAAMLNLLKKPAGIRYSTISL
jgi:hypothetical protein